MEYTAIRDRIFSFLDNGTFNQKEFAKKIDVSPQTITDWKKGKSKSFAHKIPIIAFCLGTTVEWLMTGEGDRTKLESFVREQNGEEKPATVPGDGQAQKLAQILRDVGVDVDRLSDAELWKVGKIIKAAFEE